MYCFLASVVSGLQIGIVYKPSKPALGGAASVPTVCASYVTGEPCIAISTERSKSRLTGSPSRCRIAAARPPATKWAKQRIAVLAVLGAVLLIPRSALAATVTSVVTEQRIWALLLAAAAFGSWSEEKTAIGALISGCMVTFFSAMALSTFGLLPTVSSTPAYQAVSSSGTICSFRTHECSEPVRIIG